MDDQQRARERYLSFVDSWEGNGPNGDCHFWTGPADRKGYGRFQGRLATHVALELDGRPRPSRLHGALHSCDTPRCVNPAHLRWGTQRENAAEASARLRYPNGRKTHCPKGHEYTEANTIITPRPEGWKDRKCRICANLRCKRRRAKHKEQRLSALRAAPEAIALRVAVQSLEQIANAPDDQGAKFNAMGALRFLQTQPVELSAAPEGFVMVPVEPTREMVAAGGKAAHDGDGMSAKQFYPAVYRAIVKAGQRND